VLAVAWLARPAHVQTAQRNMSEQTTERSSEELEALAASGLEPAQSAQALSRELIVETPLPTHSAAHQPSDLHGKLVLIDLDGTEQSDSYGSLTWTRWVGVVPEYYQVPVVNGEWIIAAASLQETRALSFKRVQVGLRLATVESPAGLHRPPFESEFVVRAQVQPSASLRVVDAERGVDLEGVALVTTSDSISGGRHPGIDFESRLMASALRSPIRLEEPLFPRRRFGKSGLDALLVGAPGFAWTRFGIDVEQDGEQVVVLERGSDLALNVRGVDPAARARVVLRKGKEERGEIYAEVSLRAGGCLRFSGLPSGPLQASAVVGSHQSSIELGSLELELRAGELTEETLELTRAPPLLLADASGVVLVPKAWKAKGLTLNLELQDTPLGGFVAERLVTTESTPSASEDFDAFSWSEEDLQVGTYELSMSDPIHAATLVVPLGGLAQFEVLVPPPVELLVHIVDDATGAPIEAVDVMWFLVAESGQVFPRRGRKASDPNGMVRIQAPSSQIQVYVRGEEYQRHHRSVDLRTGSCELTCRLRRACGVLLRLACEGKPVSMPADLRHHVRRTGQVESVTMTMSEAECSISLRDPGTFSFTLPEIPGFEAVPPQTVSVQPGRFTEHVIELTRKR
jgi:hypothetical protein